MFMKQCRVQDLDPTVEFLRLAGSLYNPLKMEEEKEELDDIDIENEEAEENDLRMCDL
jgi:hypothetical protein